MSGLLALLHTDGSDVAAGPATRALDAISHRGECSPRLHRDGEVALGQVHLATTREALGEQLPATFDGRYWIVWDGRLDNRDELCSRLRLPRANSAGLVTDAECAAAAFARWGDQFVEHLLGDWAVAVWDTRERRLVCAKDPIGWKGLYFAHVGGALLVATEPIQFFQGFMARRPDREYLFRFLADVVQEPGKTWYGGLRELLGGQVLVAQGDSVRVHTYWDSPRVTKRNYRHPMEYVEEFRAIFAESMRARLRTHKKVGVFLSGGIDSSYIAAIAAQQGAEVVGLTAFEPSTRWMDERDYATTVARHLGIEHQLVNISDCWSLSSIALPDAVFDCPALPPQAPAHIRLAEAAAELGIGVVLGGEGADEWMTGMPSVEGELAALRVVSAWKLARAGGRVPPSRIALAAYRASVPSSIRQGVRRIRCGVSPPPVEPFVDARAAWQPMSGSRAMPGRPGRRREREWLVYRQTAGPVVGWRERATFAPNRVEFRTPFNDRRLVELMASTPEPIKRFRGRRKDILREAEYEVLPAEIPDRSDFGLYQEILEDGVRREQGRVAAALAALGRVDGLRHDVIAREVRRWVDQCHRAWEPNWRAITAGLWLDQLAAAPSPHGEPNFLGHPVPIRKEVMSK